MRLFLLLVQLSLLRAATIKWLGIGDNWHDVGNWDLGRVPTPADDVVMDNPSGYKTYTVNVGSPKATVASLRIVEDSQFVVALQLHGPQALTVTGSCVIGGSLLIPYNSELRFQRDVAVAGNVILKGGLTAIGSKGTVVAQSRVSITRDGNHKSKINNAELRIIHELVFPTHQDDYTTTLELTNGASIVILPQASATITKATTVTGSDGTFFRNEGSVQCEHSAQHFCSVYTHFINAGSVNVTSATLRLTSSLTTTGSFDVDADSRLSLSGGSHSFQTEAVVKIDGILQTVSGTVSVSSSVFTADTISNTGAALSLNFSSSGTVSSIQKVSVTDGTINLENADSSTTSLVIKEISINGKGLISSSVPVTTKSLLLSSPSRHSTGQLKTSSSFVVTESWMWDAGTVAGEGTIEAQGNVEISQSNAGVTSVYLQVPTAVFRGQIVFRKTSSLVLGGDTHVTLDQNGVLTFGAIGCSLRSLTGHSIVDNLGLVQTTVHYTGLTEIIVGEFNNYGRVVIQSEVTSTLQFHGFVKSEGRFEIGKDDTIKFLRSGSIQGSRTSQIKGNGTLQMSSSGSTSLYNVDVPKLDVTAGTVKVSSADDFMDTDISVMTVSGGSCSLDPALRLSVDTVKISGGTLNANGQFTVGNVQMSGGSLAAVDMEVQEGFSWTGGIISGRKMTVKSMHVYNKISKTLKTIQLNVLEVLSVFGYGMTVSFSDAASVEVSEGGRLEVMGSSVSFYSSETSSALICRGDMDVKVGTFQIGISLHTYGSMSLSNSDVSLSRASTSEGNVFVGLNSSLSFLASFVASGTSRLTGTGEVVASTLASGDSIYLSSIDVENLRATKGSLIMQVNSNVTSITVTGGKLEIMEEPLSNSLEPVFIHSVSVSEGEFISGRKVIVDELTVSGRGIFTAAGDGVVKDRFQWTAGLIQGDVLKQAKLEIDGRLRIVGSDQKNMRLVDLIINKEATWRGFGNIYQQDSSSIIVSAGADFSVDTTSSLAISGSGRLLLINRGTVNVKSSRDFSISGVLQNYGNFSIERSSSLILNGHSQFQAGSLTLDDSSILKTSGSSSSRHVMSSECIVSSSKTSTLDVANGFLTIENLSFHGNLRVNSRLVILSVEAGLVMESLSLQGSSSLTMPPSRIPLYVKRVALTPSSSGAYLQLDTPLNADNITLSQGSIRGTGDITVDIFVWKGGSITGSKTSQLSVNRSLNIIQSAAKLLSFRRLQISGKSTWSGSGQLSLSQGARMTIQPEAQIFVESNIAVATSSGASFTNYGDIEHRPVIEQPGFLTLKGSVENHGTIRALGVGGLILEGSTTFWGLVELASDDSTLEIRSGTHTFKETAELRGSGYVNVKSGSMTLLTSKIDVSSARIGAGTFTLSPTSSSSTVIRLRKLQMFYMSRFSSSSDVALNIDTLQLHDGTAEFFGAANITNANVTKGRLLSSGDDILIDNCIWYGGGLSGLGRMVIRSLTIQEQAAVSRVIYSGATVIVSNDCAISGSVELYPQARLVFETNASAILFPPASLTERDHTSLLVNYGTLKLFQTTLSIPIRNEGLITISSGTITIDDSLVMDGHIEISSNADLKVKQNFRSSPDSSISGLGRLTTEGTAVLSSRVLNVSHLALSSGSLTLDLPSSYLLKTLEIFGGVLNVPLHSSVLQVDRLTMHGGKIDAYVPVILNQLYIDAGEYKARDRVDVHGLFTFQGGIVSGGGGDIASLPFTVDSLIIPSHRNPSGSYQIDKKRLVVTQNGSWTGKVGSTLQLSGLSVLEILKDAEFSISQSLESAITGNGEILNRGALLVNTIFADPAFSLNIGSSLTNYGQLVIRDDSRVLFSSGIDCPANGSVNIGNSAELRTSGLTHLACATKGHALSVVGGTLEIEESSAALFNVQLVSVETSSRLLTKGNFSVAKLKISGGTVDSFGSVVIVRDKLTFSEGTVSNIKLNSEKETTIEKSCKLNKAVLSVRRNAAIDGTLLPESAFTLTEGSKLYVRQGTVLLLRGYMPFSKDSSDCSVVNEGTIITNRLGTKVRFDLPVLNNGRFEAKDRLNFLIFQQIFPISSGTIAVTGKESVLQLTSGKTLITVKDVCDSCEIFVSGGETEINTNRTDSLVLPKVRVSKATLSFTGTNNGTITSLSLENSATFHLQSTTRVRRFIVDGSSRVRGSSAFIDTLVFRGGFFGLSQSDPTTFVTTAHLEIATGSSKRLENCKMTITKTVIFYPGQLRIQSNSQLTIASSAVGVFKSPYVQINGDNPITPDSGELLNQGLLRVQILASSASTIFNVYFSNTGTIEVKSGSLELRGSTDHRGNLTVQKGSSILFAANQHSSTAGSILNLQGTAEVKASVQWSFTLGNFGTVLVPSGTLDLRNPACISHLNISGGTVKIAAQTAVNALDFSAGFLDCSTTVAVNGLARWTAGKMTIPGSGELFFNGYTEIAPGLSNGKLTIAGSSCSYTDCTACLADTNCVWFADGGACVERTSYDRSPGKSCQSWTTSGSQCPSELSCSSFGLATPCNAQSSCTWCSSTDSCFEATYVCPGNGQNNVVYWRNRGSGPWTDGQSWSTGSAPGATSNVFISLSRRVEVQTSSAVQVKSLTVGGLSELQENQLTIRNPLTVESLRVFRGSTVKLHNSLTWTGDATIHGTIFWAGSTMSGPRLIIYGSFLLEGSTKILNANVDLRGQEEHFAGVVNFQSNKVFHVFPNASLNSYSNSFFGHVSRSTTGTRFINEGTMHVLSKSSSVPKVTHTGNLIIDRDKSFQMTASEINGTVEVESGALFTFGAVLASTANVTGLGKASLAGTVTLERGAQLNVPDVSCSGSVVFKETQTFDKLTISEGSVSIQGDVRVTDIMHWINGEIKSDIGTFTWNAAGPLLLRPHYYYWQETKKLTSVEFISSGDTLIDSDVSRSQSRITINTGGDSNFTVSAGSIFEIASLRVLSLQVPLVNKGVARFSAVSTQLYLSGGIVNYNEFLIPSPSTTVQLQGLCIFEPSSRLTVGGGLNIAGSKTQVRIQGTLSVPFYSVTISGGELRLNATNSSVRSLVSSCSWGSRCNLFLHQSIRLNFFRVSAYTTATSLGSMEAHYVKVDTSTANYFRLSETSHSTEILFWSGGTVAALSGNPSLQVNEYAYVARVYLSAVQVLLKKELFFNERSDWYFSNGAKLVVPKGAEATLMTNGRPNFQQQSGVASQIINNGTLYFQSVRRSVTSTAIGFLSLVKFINNGEFSLGGTAWFHGGSVSSGQIKIGESSHLYLAKENAWSGQVVSESNSIIEITYTSSPDDFLRIHADLAVINRLNILSRSSATLDVSPSSLSLYSVYLDNPNSKLTCNQNCSIDGALLWNAGSLLTSNENTSITVSKTATLLASEGDNKYTGFGPIIIQGVATFNTRYSLHIRKRLVIDPNGTVNIFQLELRQAASTTSPLFVNYGHIVVHHAASLRSYTPFENHGEITVKGSVYVDTNVLPGGGQNTGKINLPTSFGLFSVAVMKAFEITNTSTVSGRGTLQACSGTLEVHSLISASNGFFGNVKVINSATMKMLNYLNTSRLEIGGYSCKLILESDRDSYITNVKVTSGTLTTTGNAVVVISMLDVSGYRSILNGDSDMEVETLIWSDQSQLAGDREIIITKHLLVFGRSGSLTLSETVLIVEKSAIFGANSLSVTAAGSIEIAANAAASILSTGTIYGNSGTRLINDGKLHCGREETVLTIAIEFENDGSLFIESGTLILQGENVHSGVIEGAPGTALQLRGTSTFTESANISLSGSSLYTSSTVHLDAATQQPVFQSLYIDNREFLVTSPRGLSIVEEVRITGSASFRIESSVETPRIRLESRYATVMQSGAGGHFNVDELYWVSGEIQGLSQSSPWFIVNRLTLMTTNNQKIIRGGVITCVGQIMLTEKSSVYLVSSTLVNNGTFVADSSGSSIFRSGEAQFINNGDFFSNVGGGAVSVATEFSNFGKITVQSGLLRLQYRSLHTNGGSLNLESETAIEFSGSDHEFDDSATLHGEVDSSVKTSSGRLVICENSSNVSFSQLEITGGTVDIHETVTLEPFRLLRVSGGLARFNSSTKIQKAVLSAGTVTLPQQFRIEELLMSSWPVIEGGRPKRRALLTVNQFLYSGGTLQSATSSGKYFFINVTGELTLNTITYSCFVARADLISYTQAIVASPAFVFLQHGARLVNSRRGTMKLLHGKVAVSYSGALVNFGKLEVETSGPLDEFVVDSQLVNTGGQILISNGKLRLNGGGVCNGTGGSIYVAEGAEIRIGGTFTCLPETVTGPGSMTVVSGTFQLTSATIFTLPLKVTAGTVSVVKNVVGLRFANKVTIDGGTLRIDGLANVTDELSLVRGTLSGSGILVLSETGKLTVEFNFGGPDFQLSTQVQNFGTLLLKEPVNLGSTARLRNEKTGRMSIIGEGKISGGTVENLGWLSCRVDENSTCQLSTSLRNYKIMQIESGQLDLSSSPWLVDGSTLNGPGLLRQASSFRAGGYINADWTVTSGVSVDGPLFSTGSCTWVGGRFSSSSSGSCTVYTSGSSRLLEPECKEDFFVNEGLLIIDRPEAKSIDAGLTVVNRGVIRWELSSSTLTVTGLLFLDTDSRLNIITAPGTTARIDGSGKITNKGYISSQGKLQVNVMLQNVGTISLTETTLTPSQGNLIQRGLVVGTGNVVGNLYNEGTIKPSPRIAISGGDYSQGAKGILAVTVTEDNSGKLVSTVLDCTGEKVSLAGVVHVVWNASFVLAVGQESPAFLYFGTRENNFDTVTVEGSQGIALAAVYNSKSVNLRRKVV
eukprot:m.20126 g.20126  ORF g.20126 m.20126 type:complete len:4760 (+) comp27977_c0_seq1:44-14323(+)